MENKTTIDYLPIAIMKKKPTIEDLATEIIESLQPHQNHIDYFHCMMVSQRWLDIYTSARIWDPMCRNLGWKSTIELSCCRRHEIRQLDVSETAYRRGLLIYNWHRINSNQLQIFNARQILGKFKIVHAWNNLIIFQTDDYKLYVKRIGSHELDDLNEISEIPFSKIVCAGKQFLAILLDNEKETGKDVILVIDVLLHKIISNIQTTTYSKIHTIILKNEKIVCFDTLCFYIYQTDKNKHDKNYTHLSFTSVLYDKIHGYLNEAFDGKNKIFFRMLTAESGILELRYMLHNTDNDFNTSIPTLTTLSLSIYEKTFSKIKILKNHIILCYCLNRSNSHPITKMISTETSKAIHTFHYDTYLGKCNRFVYFEKDKMLYCHDKVSGDLEYQKHLDIHCDIYCGKIILGLLIIIIQDGIIIVDPIERKMLAVKRNLFSFEHKNRQDIMSMIKISESSLIIIYDDVVKTIDLEALLFRCKDYSD